MTRYLSIEDRLWRCPRAAGPFPPDARRCGWCGAELPKRRVRWCSRECVDEWQANHDWSSARAAALERDGHRCTVCESDGLAPVEPWGWFVLALSRSKRWAPTYREAHELLIAEHRKHRLEVDHVVPILGRHGQPGCHHHLDGLRTLCHGCHLTVTAEQFARV